MPRIEAKALLFVANRFALRQTGSLRPRHYQAKSEIRKDFVALGLTPDNV
jgi:hypothetical protein